MNAFTRWVRRQIYGEDLLAVDDAPARLERSLKPAPLGPAPPAALYTVIRTPDPEDTMTADDTSPDQNQTPPADPVTDSGVHAALPEPRTDAPTIRAACATCEGHGYVERPVNDLLRESLSLIPVDGGDTVIRDFYRRLLSLVIPGADGRDVHLGAQLAPLFPRDLLTAATQDGASPGAMQRDKLLQALIALAELHGTGNPDDQQRLDTALGSFGRSHAAFQRPDGVYGATEEEYDAVGDVLAATLAGAAGTLWRPEYTRAWRQAYSYAKVGMLWAQYHSGMHAARYPRRDAHHD